mgnify:FL=1
MSDQLPRVPEPTLVGADDEGRVFLLGPSDVPVPADPGSTDEDPVSEFVEEPAKVMRIGRMISKLLEEVKDAPLDDASRNRLAQIYDASIKELSDGLAPELADELARITRPFASNGTAPSDSELRIAQAQLVGWLEGLFQGIQTALVAQQMAAASQLENMRRALPKEAGQQRRPEGRPDASGMYL